MFSCVNLSVSSSRAISPLSFKSMILSILSVAVSPLAKFFMGWPFSHDSGSHALMRVMIFLTSSSFRLILAVPSSTCLSVVFFFVFLLRCSLSTAIYDDVFLSTFLLHKDFVCFLKVHQRLYTTCWLSSQSLDKKEF